MKGEWNECLFEGGELAGECCVSLRIMQGVNSYSIWLCVSSYYSREEAEGLRIAHSQPRPTSLFSFWKCSTCS